MTGPEHYGEAEQLLARMAGPQNPAQHAATIAEAQVHATLAIAAALDIAAVMRG